MQHTGAALGRVKASGAPPEHFVRHCFWKYPLIAGGLAVVLVAVAFALGSPNSSRDTIAQVSNAEPGGAILAFTQELSGTAASWENAGQRGMGEPSQVFVLGPVSDFADLLGANVVGAAGQYREADTEQRRAWAVAYEQALETITPKPTGAAAASGTTPSPDYTRIDSLSGDFGPVPTLTQADLVLAQRGYLEQYLVGRDPGHSLQLGTIWLYDHPAMLNTAIALGLTDDQWGMVKERGFPVGPWYLIVPATLHVKFPGGSVGTGFVLWNLLAALIFLFVVPLVPGVRDLPRRIGLYRFIYRYPNRDEQATPRSTSRGEGPGDGRAP